MVIHSTQPLARAEFRCGSCKNLAGRVELLPAGHADGLGKTASTIFLKDFIGTEKVALSPEQSQAIHAALTYRDAAALYKIDELFAPFYCATCACVYCRKHWVVVPEFEDGFFDCAHGWCPEGHKRLIED
jgi:hypothetical protein